MDRHAAVENAIDLIVEGRRGQAGLYTEAQQASRVKLVLVSHLLPLAA